LLEGRTAIVIAHRLATVGRVDEIIVLEDGRIGEHGAREALASDPQFEAERDRHSGYYLALLRERETALLGAAQREVIDELTAEIGNLHAAWAWAVQRERFVSLGPALRSFRLLHLLAGWLRAGIEPLDLLVETLREVLRIRKGRQWLIEQSGIDPVLRRKFWDYFRSLRDNGHTLFVTTQYVGEAAYCDYVGVMARGRLLATPAKPWHCR